MKAMLSTGAVVLGMVLLVMSLAWGLLFPASAGWTEEKSVKLKELRNRAHILSGEVASASAKPNMHGGPSAADKKAELDQVKAELDSLDAELQGKIDAPATASSILRYAGIAFVVAGGLAVYAGRG